MTVNSPEKRLIGHKSNARQGSPRLCMIWIRELWSEGLEPELIIFEREASPEREAFWIAEYRAAGYSLFNLSTGGEKGAVGSVRSAETRAKMSEGQRGNKHRSGQTNSPEHRAKISSSMRGNKNGCFTRTDEHREATRLAMLGHNVPPEVRAKIAATLTGRKLPQEVRDKIAAANHGRTWTVGPEGRKKMSESAKRRHQRERDEKSR